MSAEGFLPDLDAELAAPPDMLVVTEDENGGDVHDPSNGELGDDTRIAMLVRALIIELAPTIVEALASLQEDADEGDDE